MELFSRERIKETSKVEVNFVFIRCSESILSSMRNCVRINIKETYYYKPIYMHEDDNRILRPPKPPTWRPTRKNVLEHDIICKIFLFYLFLSQIVNSKPHYPIITKNFPFSRKLSSPKAIKHHISNCTNPSTSKPICHLILSNYNSIPLSFYPYLYSNPNDIPRSLLLNRSCAKVYIHVFEPFKRMNWRKSERIGSEISVRAKWPNRICSWFNSFYNLVPITPLFL